MTREMRDSLIVSRCLEVDKGEYEEALQRVQARKDKKVRKAQRKLNAQRNRLQARHRKKLRDDWFFAEEQAKIREKREVYDLQSADRKAYFAFASGKITDDF